MFQSSGKIPVSIALLNINANVGAMTGAETLIILQENPSKPVALFDDIFFIIVSKRHQQLSVKF